MCRVGLHDFHRIGGFFGRKVRREGLCLVVHIVGDAVGITAELIHSFEREFGGVNMIGVFAVCAVTFSHLQAKRCRVMCFHQSCKNIHHISARIGGCFINRVDGQARPIFKPRKCFKI